MATLITKNSSTASAVPLAANLTQGELAVNVTDKKLYTKDSGGNVVLVSGDVTLTGTQTLTNKTLTSPTLTAPVLGTPASGTVTNLTGTASININGTVGATTATTGAFTTLAASGAVTLSGGTANGVTYLNGSKVLTSGSALTFDGNTLSSTALSASGSTVTYNLLTLKDTGTTYSSSNWFTAFNNSTNATVGSLYHPEVQSLGIGSTTALVFGIGSTPSEQMRLTSTGLGIGTTSPSTVLDVASSNSGITLTNTGASNKKWRIGGNASGYFVITESGVADRLFIDTSGNVGIGTSSPADKLEVYSTITARASSGTSALRLRNTTTDMQWQSVAGTNAVSLFDSGAGLTRLTVDSSGNLLVGTTTANGKISLYGTTSSTATSIDGTGRYKGFELYDSGVRKAYLNNDQTNTITSLNTAYGTLTFGTGDTERARIDTSGNLLVGTTATVNAGKQVNAFNGSTQNGLVVYDTANGNNAGFVVFNENGTVIGSISRVGTTSAVIYNTTSDYRLKTVSGAVTGQGARIDALEPIEYTWNESGTSTRGFLAHEFQTVYPNSVSGDKDAVDTDGNPKYQSMQAATSEVIADLVAEIQSLRQRLSAANL